MVMVVGARRVIWDTFEWNMFAVVWRSGVVGGGTKFKFSLSPKKIDLPLNYYR